ncbi:MAG: DegT/DnrJ/EryC1/StrS family aminotransferase, partial [Rhizorhabdus sp.]
WYSNFGPLVLEFEARLAERLGLPSKGVATVANATMGLSLSLQATGAPRGTLCLLPSWTFSASVHAVVEAGLIPFFVDVDDEGRLTPALAREALDAAQSAVGAVMPVSVYGQPIDPTPWEEFSEATGLPIVIDAAPGFDGVRAGRVISVVSLHATKVLGVGEGGFVMSSNTALVAEVRRKSNFGFDGSREAQVAGGNGKISEYAAAVGLACLDEWLERRAALVTAARHYQGNLSTLDGISQPLGWGESWCSTTCVVRLDRPAASVAAALNASGIETRAWWGDGMHVNRAFAGYPRMPLPTTECLAETTIGLPFFIDMTADEIDRVCGMLAQELAHRR